MHGRISHYLLMATICAVILLSPAYSATLQIYSDPTVFSGLTENTSLITFDDSSTVNEYGSSGYYAEWQGSAGQVQFTSLGGYSYFSLLVPTAPQINWGTGKVLEASGGPGQSLQIALPGTGVTAVGLNLMTLTQDVGSTYNSGGTITITLSTGDVISNIPTAYWATSMGASPYAAGVGPTWWGVTSDTPITWINVTSSTGAIVIDNLDFGAVNPLNSGSSGNDTDAQTPEVATMILIGTGLVAIRLLGKYGAKPTPA